MSTLPDTYRTIRNARQLIEDPAHHLKLQLSNGVGGYCAVGALIEATGRSNWRHTQATCGDPNNVGVIMATACRDTYPEYSGPPWLDPLGSINNIEGHDAVMRIFDRALQICEQRLAKTSRPTITGGMLDSASWSSSQQLLASF